MDNVFAAILGLAFILIGVVWLIARSLGFEAKTVLAVAFGYWLGRKARDPGLRSRDKPGRGSSR
jgi:hypothetical protein